LIGFCMETGECRYATSCHLGATSRPTAYFNEVTNQSVQTCIAGEPRACVEQPRDRRLDRDCVTRVLHPIGANGAGDGSA
jgi:hypothetical protein